MKKIFKKLLNFLNKRKEKIDNKNNEESKMTFESLETGYFHPIPTSTTLPDYAVGYVYLNRIVPWNYLDPNLHIKAIYYIEITFNFLGASTKSRVSLTGRKFTKKEILDNYPGYKIITLNYIRRYLNTHVPEAINFEESFGKNDLYYAKYLGVDNCITRFTIEEIFSQNSIERFIQKIKFQYGQE